MSARRAQALESTHLRAILTQASFPFPMYPPGTYQIVFWDKFLDNIFAFLGVTVAPGGGSIDLGDVGVFRWFGTIQNLVFYDTNENGIRDPGEDFVFPEQAVNLRFRDGSLYQSMPTDLMGESPLEEVFPFFNWLVAEVDFLRFKATGVTVTVDEGGGPLVPGSNVNPQIQEGGLPFRTETGPVLTQGVQVFLGQTNVIEWGKKEYGPGENGGISGIVFYASTTG
jgi:large repetitive protein